MKGDRIIAQSSLMLNTQDEVLPVYKPKLNPDGSFVTAFDGSVVLERAGGVKSGSTGTVQGDPIRVHRTQLYHLQLNSATALGGNNDFMPVYPIFLDIYQQIGWLPVDHIRVVSGGKI